METGSYKSIKLLRFPAVLSWRYFSNTCWAVRKNPSSLMRKQLPMDKGRRLLSESIFMWYKISGNLEEETFNPISLLKSGMGFGAEAITLPKNRLPLTKLFDQSIFLMFSVFSKYGNYRFDRNNRFNFVGTRG